MADETQQESAENKAERVALSHIQIRVTPKQKTQQKGARKKKERQKKVQTCQHLPRALMHLQMEMVPPSHRGAIRDTVALKQSGAAEAFNSTKCAKVQLHLQ